MPLEPELAPKPAELTPTVGSPTVELDERTLPHGARHLIIFANLQRLAAGGTFVIRNDHDPQPLRYQTESP